MVFRLEFLPTVVFTAVMLCLAISHWAALIGAGLVFAIGTRMRIRSEEKLLREGFGPEFEAYARSVPALVPRLSGFTTRSILRGPF